MSRREELRARYPDLARWIDDYRETFGVTWFELRDNGDIFAQHGPVPDRSKWKLVEASPGPPPPLKKGKRR